MVIRVNFSRFPKILAPPFRPESEIFLARYGSKLAGGALGNYLVPIYRFPPAQQTAVKRGEFSFPPFFLPFSRAPRRDFASSQTPAPAPAL